MEICINHATKYIKKALILDDVCLKLSSGTVYGLNGPNGSGKTMLMRLVAGLIRPTSGEIIIDGQKLGVDMDFPTSMGLLIEQPAFISSYTGFRNLQLLAEIRGKTRPEQIRKAIIDVGLSPNDTKKYRKYSLGMKQRLGIAAAIMECPDIILLDEPSNALDVAGAKQIKQLIHRERNRGAIVMLASHDSSFLNSVSDRIISISDGRIQGG